MPLNMLIYINLVNIFIYTTEKHFRKCKQTRSDPNTIISQLKIDQAKNTLTKNANFKIHVW